MSFSPIPAQAGFFSSILGDQVFAQADKPVSTTLTETSATMSLPYATVSLASILEDESDDKDSQHKDTSIGNNTNLHIVSDVAILPSTGPLGVSDGKDVWDSNFLETSVYVVRKGDSISQIAEMYGVSINTILWANDMKKGDKLIEGDVLFILPISGLEHTVTKGQTLQSISKIYKVELDDIALYNDLALNASLAIGEELMIPGGSMAHEGGDKPASNLVSAPNRDKNYYDTHPIQNLAGYFINPVPTGRKTQGLHGPGHRGIDIGASTGTPIYASATGVVIVAKTGCTVGKTRCGGGYGNMVTIQHPNGTKTLYAHMSKVGTSIGASVSRGQIIGFVGNTGRSSGPHIHFEVFNAKNPGSDWSWVN